MVHQDTDWKQASYFCSELQNEKKEIYSSYLRTSLSLSRFVSDIGDVM